MVGGPGWDGIGMVTLMVTMKRPEQEPVWLVMLCRLPYVFGGSQIVEFDGLRVLG